MKKILFTVFITGLICISCYNKKPKEYKFSLKKDTISIDTMLKTTFLDFSSINEINDSIFICFKPAMSSYMYTYYYKNEQMLFLKKDKLLESYLNKENGKITSAILISRDSIIFSQERLLSIYNLKSKEIIFKYIQTDTSLIYITDRNQPYYYDKINKLLILYIINSQGQEKSNRISDIECIAELNLRTNKLKILPINLSEDYNTDKIYLPFNDPYYAVNDHYILTAYGISPDINIYDRLSGKSSFKTLKHKYYSEIKGIPKDSAKYKDYLINVITKSFRYFKLIYDKHNNVFYRFYELSMDKERKGDGLLYTYSDKAMGVNIIDDKFNVIDDIILEGIHLPPNWSSTSAGLLQLTTTKDSRYVLSKLNIEEK